MKYVLETLLDKQMMKIKFKHKQKFVKDNKCDRLLSVVQLQMLDSPSITTIVPYANSLDPDETPRRLTRTHAVWHLDYSLKNLNDFEALWKLMQTKHLAGDIFSAG